MNGWLLAQVPSPTSTSPAPAGGTPTPVAPPATGVGGGVEATTQQSGTQSAKPAVDAPSPFSGLMIPLILVMVVGYFFMSRGPKKEEKKRKAMLDGMKRGDEVETIGGLVGKVVDVKENHVVIKVDESANVKATYKKGAILKVITQEDKDKEREKEKADDKK